MNKISPHITPCFLERIDRWDGWEVVQDGQVRPRHNNEEQFDVAPEERHYFVRVLQKTVDGEVVKKRYIYDLRSARLVGIKSRGDNSHRAKGEETFRQKGKRLGVKA